MTVKSQPQIRRRSACHRHPSTPVTGFCASCLRERLAGIESAAAASGVSSGNKPPSRELRRSKSCSEDFPANLNPGGDDSNRRKSCDVVPRGGGSSLWNLFNRDDESVGPPRNPEAEIGNLGFDLKEEEEEEARVRVEAETKTMKELIDLEWSRKKSGGGGAGRDLREIAGTFWGKASGLSKKLVKWKRKSKSKKKKQEEEEEEEDEENNYDDGVSRRETQSEVGEYGFSGNRRSCDADPRRMSVDECRRFSFDEPRASWDGYLIGKTTTATRVPPMVAVVEDGDSSSSPGGSEQTRDYYCRGRRSFECGNGNSDAKVSPATTDLFYGAKLLLANDLKKPDTTAAASKKKTNPPMPIQGWGKMWSIWSGGGGKGKDCPVSQKLIRSYSVSCRNEAGPGNDGSLRSREDLALQKNRSVRYSPANADAGLLRFYLTPLRSHGHGRRAGQSRRKNVL